MPPKSSAKSKTAGLDVTVTVRSPRLRGAETAVRALQVLDGVRDQFEIAGSVMGGARPPGAPARSAVGPSAPGGRAPPVISLVFLTDEALAELHDQFLSDPTPTDVITFPADPGFGQLGEICVSVDAAARQPGREFSDELALYVVHGWLHLAGHDDLQPAKKRRMRRAEQKALGLLRAAGAMPRFTLRRSFR